MSKLDEIKKPVKDQIAEFEQVFKQSMKSKVPLLDKVTRYIVKRKGKQMRPMFVFLTANMISNGSVSRSTYHAASLIELLHTATLIHDDVVDDSSERRGFFSLNALWKNKISVLVGDYLLSRGLLLAVDNSEFDLLRIVSNATREMSEGELLQIEKARRLDIQEPVYFDIIRKKTASLIASCCAAGASSAQADEETIEKMRRFGEYTGIAFQIKDDLFDYQNTRKTGKPNGIDIKEKKMTLPLIYMLSQASSIERRKYIRVIKRKSDNIGSVQKIIQRVNESGGIEYARDRMIEYRDKALEMLNDFPDNTYRASLRELVIYTTERKK
jgi:octaprenyl-diphosphate synthase